MYKYIKNNCTPQEVLLFPAMKPDDPNKHNTEDDGQAQPSTQNGA